MSPNANPNPNPNPGFSGNAPQNFGNNGAYRPQPQPQPAPQAPQAPPQQPSFGNGGNFGAPMEQHRTFDRIPPVGQPQQAPQQPGVQFGSNAPSPMPPPPPATAPAWQSQSGSAFPPQQQQQQPQQQAPQSFGQAPLGAQPPIFLIFNNNRYVVDKDKFIIGRGSLQTDLTIRDGNISRQHCCVIYRNGAY